KLNANFGKADQNAQMFEIPQGAIDCGLFGKIDLSQMLGAYGQKPPPTVPDPVVTDADPNCPMIEFKELSAGLYNPPRPLLPSFIAGDKNALAKMHCTRSVTLQ